MKTIKNALVLAFLMITSVVLAQSVKIKKNKILYDNKEVAIIENPYRDHYVYSTLSGDKQFTVQLDGEAFTDANIMHYLKVSNADASITTQIEYEVLLTSFSVERIITHLLAVKYQLLDQNGINTEKLSAFFEKERENLGDTYKAIVVNEATKEAEKQERYHAIIEQYRPQLESDQTITFKDYVYTGNQGLARKSIVGRYQALPYEVGIVKPYLTVYDLDGILVGSLWFDGARRTYRVTTWDDNSYDFTSNRTYNITNKELFTEFVIDLIDHGYELGHQIKQNQAALYQAKIVLAKETSVNVYDARGYLVDDKGETYSGNITILFQQLDVHQTGQKLPEYGPDNYGQRVFVTYTNDKGTTRQKSFDAKDSNYFCLEQQDGNLCYYGLRTKGEAMKKLQNLDAFKLNNAYYYLLLEKRETIMLLQDPVEQTKFVIKISQEDKGQMIDERSNDKLSEVLADYLSGCPELSEDIRSGAFDLKLEDNLYQIIKEYDLCKKRN